MNNNPKQIEAKIIGDKGCYFLSIIHSVSNYSSGVEDGREVDIIMLYEIALAEKWIGNDCFVERPDLIAGYILGVPMWVLREAAAKGTEIRQVKVAKRELSYEPAENEIEITRYEKTSTGSTYAHFVETRNGEVLYDPYGNSNTVSKGSPVSKRILTISTK
jgi:hypothetical protein